MSFAKTMAARACLAVVAALAMSGAATAAEQSVNCRNVRSASAQAICASPALLELDRAHLALYRDATIQSRRVSAGSAAGSGTINSAFASGERRRIDRIETP